VSDGDLRSRLRRLRREEPPSKEAQGDAGAREGLPAWLRARLSRGRSAGAEPPELAARRRPGEPRELSEESSARGLLAARTTRLPAGHPHGAWRLDAVDSASPGDLALLARDPAVERLDLRRAVYLDIETTGLSGGAGTTPFMVGLGSFEAGGFSVWQGFLRQPGEEAAMLQACADRIAASSGVVSFFGKSFDRHRLEDKMRLHSIEPPFEGRPHLDLYHPCARLYRPALEDGRLPTMERSLLGLSREADLPGSFAPAAWFDFLAGRAHLCEEVLRHNLDDVLSLVILAAHLGCTLREEDGGGQPLAGPSASRAAGLGRLLMDERRREEALPWLERALERWEGPEREGGRALRLLRADALRHLHRDEEALEEYEALAGEAPGELGVRCWIEAAKILEHRHRNPAAALEACERARTMARLAESSYRLVREIDRRRERLMGKAGRDG